MPPPIDTVFATDFARRSDLTPPDPARFTTPGPAERFLIRLSGVLLLVFVGLVAWQAVIESCGL